MLTNQSANKQEHRDRCLRALHPNLHSYCWQLFKSYISLPGCRIVSRIRWWCQETPPCYLSACMLTGHLGQWQFSSCIRCHQNSDDSAVIKSTQTSQDRQSVISHVSAGWQKVALTNHVPVKQTCWLGWRLGVVVSVVGRINEVNQHRARLVHDGWPLCG